MATKIKNTPSRWLRPSITGVMVLALLPIVLFFSAMFDRSHLGNSKAVFFGMMRDMDDERSYVTPSSLTVSTEAQPMVGTDQMMMVKDAEWVSTPSPAGTVSPTIVPDRSIATTASITARVQSADWSVGKIREIVTGKSGYVQETFVSRPTYGERSAWMTVKVPAADFLATFEEMKQVFTRVTGENVSASDITAAVYDTQARLKNKRVEETRLQGLLETTEDVTNVLKITDRLSQVRTEIEALEASERTLNEQTAMAAVSINLTEDPQVGTDTNNFRSGNVFKVAVNELTRGLIQIGSGLVIVVVAGLPIVLAYLLCLWIIYFFVKKGVKRFFDR